MGGDWFDGPVHLFLLTRDDPLSDSVRVDNVLGPEPIDPVPPGDFAVRDIWDGLVHWGPMGGLMVVLGDLPKGVGEQGGAAAWVPESTLRTWVKTFTNVGVRWLEDQ